MRSVEELERLIALLERREQKLSEDLADTEYNLAGLRAELLEAQTLDETSKKEVFEARDCEGSEE